jgi:hypothetical protein
MDHRNDDAFSPDLPEGEVNQGEYKPLRCRSARRPGCWTKHCRSGANGRWARSSSYTWMAYYEKVYETG